MEISESNDELAGRVAVVAGGGGAFGMAIATALSRLGATVIIADRSEAIVSLSSLDPSIRTYDLDLTDEIEVGSLFSSLEREYARLDVMVHTVGMFIRRDISEISQAEWDATLAVNLRSFFLCTQAAIRSMRARNEGRIIGITSSIGTVGRPQSSAYAASKAAMQAFTRAVAVDLAATGITINCIGPGITESPLMRGANSDEEIAASLARSGRPVSSPEAIVGPIRYLLSEATRTVSGTTLWMRPPR